MPIADDWSINYNTKQIYQHNWKDEINGSNSSVAEVQKFTCLAKAAISASDYFYLYSAKDETAYFVWYDTTGSDPAPTGPNVTGKTGIEVDISADTTAIEVATRTVTALDAANYGKDFNADNTGGASATVTVTNWNKGSCTNASDENTGFTSFEITTAGKGETVYSTNALYSYLQDTFDELGQMDDAVPMSAQTPTDYTLINGWFMDEVSIKYLTGGALKTDGWLRNDAVQVGTDNIGIVQAPWSTETAAPVASDIGKAITHAAGDSGTVLFFDLTRKLFWIRPASTAQANSFDSTSGDLTVTSGTGVVNQSAAASSGENLWANVYTLGTIQTTPYPQIYIFQNGTSISEWSTLTNWDRGQIDVLIRVKEMGTEIDGANITVFARQGGNLYDHFSIDLTAGGRNAVPLSTATDLNNYTTGDYYLMYHTEASGPFNVYEVIRQCTDNTYKVFTTNGWSAQIVAVTDDGTTGTLKLTNVKGTPANDHYFRAITSSAAGATAQVRGSLGDTYVTYDAEGGTPPSVGTTMLGGTSGAKRILRGIQDDGTSGKLVLQVDTTQTGNNRDAYYISFGDNEQIQQNGTPANYYYSSAASTTIVSGWDDITIAFVNGTATTGGTTVADFIPGEKVTFTGGSAILLSDASNTLTLGNCTITAISGLVITGAISGAQATPNQNLQSAYTMEKNFTQQSAFNYAVIINAGSIYNTGRTLAQVYEYLKFITMEDSSFDMYTVVSAVITILDGEEYIQAYTGYTPVKSAPFGTFAGGTFFGAQGVWIEGMAASQSYQFIDDAGDTKSPYPQINITVSTVASGDRVTVFQTSSGTVNKAMYEADTNAVNATTIAIDTTPALGGVASSIYIDTDEEGVIRVVDTSENTEHRYRYSSWTGSTFTLLDLNTVHGSGSATSNDVTGTTLTDNAAAFASAPAILPGDLIRNSTDGSWAHVISVTATQITHTPLQGGSENDWDIGDVPKFNTLPVGYANGDTIYVPYIDETASATSIQKTVLYDTITGGSKTVLIRVRQKGILPYESTSTVSSTGMSVSAIRNTDSIVT